MANSRNTRRGITLSPLPGDESLRVRSSPMSVKSGSSSSVWPGGGLKVAGTATIKGRRVALHQGAGKLSHLDVSVPLSECMTAENEFPSAEFIH